MSYDDTRSRKLPASAGIDWFLQGLKAARMAPISMLGVVLFYLLVMGGLSSLPLAGTVIAAFFMPFGTVFVARSTRDVLAGKMPTYSVFKELWNTMSVRRSLVRIGVVYSFVLIAVEAVYGFMAADEISRWVITDNRLDWESVRANFPWDATIASLVIYLPGVVSVWFAPMLAAQNGMPPGKALFYSFFGCLRNFVPVIVLVLVMGAVIMLAATAVVGVAVSLSSETLASWLTIPLVFFAAVVMYARYWPMYRDLFGDVD